MSEKVDDRLANYLKSMIEKGLDIEAEMEGLPHRVNAVRRSLGRRGYVYHLNGFGFAAELRGPDGSLYQVHFYRRG